MKKINKKYLVRSLFFSTVTRTSFRKKVVMSYVNKWQVNNKLQQFVCKLPARSFWNKLRVKEKVSSKLQLKKKLRVKEKIAVSYSNLQEACKKWRLHWQIFFKGIVKNLINPFDISVTWLSQNTFTKWLLLEAITCLLKISFKMLSVCLSVFKIR